MRALTAVGALVVLALALLGPWLAPGSPTVPVGRPFAAATLDLPLGTDILGRDALTRVLLGGRVLVLQAAAATLLGSVIGIGTGAWAALTHRDRAARALLRGVDALAAFPALLLLLLLAAGVPDSAAGVTIAIALVSTPFAVRVSHARVLAVAAADHARQAEARGDGLGTRLVHDVLPGLAPVALAEAGLRFVAATQLAATAGFLGLGAGAPAAAWGRMVRENAVGIATNPLPVLVPAVLLVLLALGATALLDRVERGAAVQITRGAR